MAADQIQPLAKYFTAEQLRYLEKIKYSAVVCFDIGRMSESVLNVSGIKTLKAYDMMTFNDNLLTLFSINIIRRYSSFPEGARLIFHSDIERKIIETSDFILNGFNDFLYLVKILDLSRQLMPSDPTSICRYVVADVSIEDLISYTGKVAIENKKMIKASNVLGLINQIAGCQEAIANVDRDWLAGLLTTEGFHPNMRLPKWHNGTLLMFACHMELKYVVQYYLVLAKIVLTLENDKGETIYDQLPTDSQFLDMLPKEVKEAPMDLS